MSWDRIPASQGQAAGYGQQVSIRVGDKPGSKLECRVCRMARSGKAASRQSASFLRQPPVGAFLVYILA